MASGQVARSAVRARKKAPSNNNNNTTDKWVGKKYKVEPGDIIKFHTPNPHMLGGIGTVVGYLDKNTILIKTFGGLDTDYPPMFVSIRNQAANENYNNNSNNGRFQAHYQQYITGIAHRMTPKRPKKRKPVQFHEVTHEDLPAVLTGEQTIPDGHKVVLVPTPEAADVQP